MRRVCVTALALLGIVAGCTQKDLTSELVPPADQALALHYVDMLRQRNFDEIDRAVDPSVRGPKLYEALLKNAEVLPEDAPSSSKMVDARVRTEKDETRFDIILEYDFSGKWVLANVALLHKKDSVSLAALSVRAISESVEQRHAFRLAGKSPMHFVVLTLAIAFPLLTLYALVTCLTTRLSSMKWPWVLFILLSFGRFAINWTTGETQFSPLAIGVFGASLTGVSFGAWTLSVSLPIGALVFLFRKKALTAAPPKA